MDMNAFEARYPGRCHLCREAIEPGDTVCYVDDVLVHAECDREDEIPDEDTPRRNERHCKDCFTLHAGDCP